MALLGVGVCGKDDANEGRQREQVRPVSVEPVGTVERADNFILAAAPRVGWSRAAAWAVVAATKTAEAQPMATSTPDAERLPSSTPVPARGRDVLPQDGIAVLICSYAWDCGTALRIARCESGLNPGAISPDGQNVGVMQINLIHGYSTAYLLDAANNIAAAYQVYLNNAGFSPWACY